MSALTREQERQIGNVSAQAKRLLREQKDPMMALINGATISYLAEWILWLVECVDALAAKIEESS